MMDPIDRQAAIDVAVMSADPYYKDGIIESLMELPSAQPEWKKDTIQQFHDYQIEWLKAHNDIELEPHLEELIIRFLHDTADCYMMELDRSEKMRNTGTNIIYAIEKEVSRYSFVEWLEEWEISEEDWNKFMEAGKAAFNEECEQE